MGPLVMIQDLVPFTTEGSRPGGQPLRWTSAATELVSGNLWLTLTVWLSTTQWLLSQHCSATNTKM